MTIEYCIVLAAISGEIELLPHYITGNIKGFGMVDNVAGYPRGRRRNPCAEGPTPLVCCRLREMVKVLETLFDHTPKRLFGFGRNHGSVLGLLMFNRVAARDV
jgi:hypothetical protein